MGKSFWINHGFINKSLYGPFSVKTDIDYYSDLHERFSIIKSAAIEAGADENAINIINEYSNGILSSIQNYYLGNIINAYNDISSLVKGCLFNHLSDDILKNCEAFGLNKECQIQFFRARINPSAIPYKSEEMLHIPQSMRGKIKNERFGIPGMPCLYVSNSSYCCWLEIGRPSEHDFCVSPCLLDDDLRVFNLAVMNRDMHALDDCNEERVLCWIKLLMLMIATSYRIEEENRTFHSEYIVSQLIMIACKESNLDGVVYYSSRVEDHFFAQSAINVALYADYKSLSAKQSKVSQRVKIGDSYNYQLFRQLNTDSLDIEYPLRCLSSGLNNVLGDYNRNIEYEKTDFCRFDKFLFATWNN